MATSSVDIVNSAALKLGVAPIASLDDGVKFSIAASNQYDKCRKQVLRAHPWNFAIRRVELASVVATPAFGFDYVFALPTNCLRVLPDPEYYDTEYKVEGRYIYTNESTFKIKYIEDIEDVTLFDSCFEEALACALARDLAIHMKNSTQLAQLMDGAYRMALKEARAVDAQEGTPEVIRAFSWRSARY